MSFVFMLDMSLNPKQNKGTEKTNKSPSSQFLPPNLSHSYHDLEVYGWHHFLQRDKIKSWIQILLHIGKSKAGNVWLVLNLEFSIVLLMATPQHHTVAASGKKGNLSLIHI